MCGPQDLVSLPYGECWSLMHDVSYLSNPVVVINIWCLVASWRFRYRGPHSWELPPEALKAPPRPWQDFFGGTPLASRYDLPASLGHLQHRLDENFVRYLVRGSSFLRTSKPTFQAAAVATLNAQADWCKRNVCRLNLRRAFGEGTSRAAVSSGTGTCLPDAGQCGWVQANYLRMAGAVLCLVL